jgi:hypothetical protein
VFERRHKEGGHFAAYKKPKLLVDDIRTMIQSAEPPMFFFLDTNYGLSIRQRPYPPSVCSIMLGAETSYVTKTTRNHASRQHDC